MSGHSNVCMFIYKYICVCVSKRSLEPSDADRHGHARGEVVDAAGGAEGSLEDVLGGHQIVREHVVEAAADLERRDALVVEVGLHVRRFVCFCDVARKYTHTHAHTHMRAPSTSCQSRPRTDQRRSCGLPDVKKDTEQTHDFGEIVNGRILGVGMRVSGASGQHADTHQPRRCGGWQQR